MRATHDAGRTTGRQREARRDREAEREKEKEKEEKEGERERKRRGERERPDTRTRPDKTATCNGHREAAGAIIRSRACCYRPAPQQDCEAGLLLVISTT